MPTRSITDDIIIDDPDAIERLVELLEEGESKRVTDEKLKKASDIKDEINNLEYFLRTFKDCWRKLRIRKCSLFTNYGIYSDELVANKRLTDRIEKAIEDELKELKQEFEEL